MGTVRPRWPAGHAATVSIGHGREQSRRLADRAGPVVRAWPRGRLCDSGRHAGWAPRGTHGV